MLPSIASGEAMISYGLSEREAGSDAAAMKTRAAPRRRHLGAQRHQGLDHQLRHLRVVHGHGRHRPGRRAPTASPRSSCTATTRASPSAPRNARWASRARPPARSTSTDCTIPADRIIGEPGTGFKTALRTLDLTRLDHRRAGAGHRAGRARRGGRLRQGAARSSAQRSPSSRASSSCSPTWRCASRRPASWSTWLPRGPSVASRT